MPPGGAYSVFHFLPVKLEMEQGSDEPTFYAILCVLVDLLICRLFYVFVATIAAITVSFFGYRLLIFSKRRMTRKRRKTEDLKYMVKTMDITTRTFLPSCLRANGWGLLDLISEQIYWSSARMGSLRFRLLIEAGI